jgi:hypothetical protein
VLAMVDGWSDLYLVVDLVGSTVKTPSTDGMVVISTTKGLIMLERKVMTRE